MIIEPTNLNDAKTSKCALRTIRAKCPGLAGWSDAKVLALAATLAHSAYSGARQEIWDFGAALDIPEVEFRVILREALATIYPAAILTGDASAIAS